MKGSFKRIERHLFERRYTTASGEGRKLFYGVFRCRLKGKPRQIPLGTDLKVARDQLKILEARNVRREDFDLDKVRPEPKAEPQRLTLTGFKDEYLKTKEEQRSYGFFKLCVGHLVRVFGDTPLEDITRTKIFEYRKIRHGEPICRHGKPVAGSKISDSTINREVTVLLNLLNIAAENGVLEKVPASRKLKVTEVDRIRDRILDQDEYKALLAAAPRWLQRIFVCANEAALSRGDLLTLTWPEIHRKRPEAAVIKIQGGRNKTKERQVVPISPTLDEVLDELEEERKRVTSIQGNNFVFVRGGKRISEDSLYKAAQAAMKKAKVNDFRLHDFRRCANTRWMLAGIEGYLRKLGMGHSRGSVHEGYISVPDEMVYGKFAERLGWNVRRVFDGNVAAK